MQSKNLEAPESTMLESGSLRRKVPQRGGWGFVQGSNSGSNRTPTALAQEAGLKPFGPECSAPTLQKVAARHDGSRSCDKNEHAATDWIPV